ncbi:MAG: hypothetical protein IJJ60_05800, partial [Clostridia bacterium]|nr:hypothetical protein [Clostridia bacterium]
MIKKLLKRSAALLGALTLAGSMTPASVFAEEALEQPVLNPRVKSIIEADGYQFIDLNGNGALDKY